MSTLRRIEANYEEKHLWPESGKKSIWQKLGTFTMECDLPKFYNFPTISQYRLLKAKILQILLKNYESPDTELLKIHSSFYFKTDILRIDFPTKSIAHNFSLYEMEVSGLYEANVHKIVGLQHSLVYIIQKYSFYSLAP